MDWHRPEKAVFDVREDGADVLVGCRYWDVRHSAEAGGNMASIIFPHGSGENIFAAPCSTEVNVRRHGGLVAYQNALDRVAALSHGREGERVWVESQSEFVSADGERLRAAVRHRFEYNPWGYVRQRVTVTCTEPIPDVWQFQVARPVVAKHLNEFAFRRSYAEAGSWRLPCRVQRWHKLEAGESFHDYCAAQTAQIPLYFIFVKRGVEGFDWFLGDNLDQWHKQVADVAHVNQFRVSYRGEYDGYEVRMCPMDYWPQNVELKGTYTFDFFMGLPFVQERVRPMVRCIGGLLEARKDRAGTAFPGPATIAKYGAHAAQLTRLHNDGPSRDGIFWRDCDYPPYPPKRMKAMDRCIARLHREGVRVVPYFSLHEWHPEVAPFAKKAREWQRVVDDAGTMLHNFTPVGEFGAQMCLRSGWLDFRKKTIDVVLANHKFDGIYYDWAQALPCLHAGHARFAHWDVEGFIDLLEWTRERVGPDGVVYLHMSNTPFMVAENLANYILTYEESQPDKLNPDIFPPHTQFMKTCPRGALVRGCGNQEPQRFILCALLNHIAPDSRVPEALAAFKAAARLDFTRYRAFENHRTDAVRASSRDVRAAIYWNEKEALVLLANLAEQPREFTWKVHTRRIGWGRAGYRVVGKSPQRLAPLSFRYVKVRRVKGKG